MVINTRSREGACRLRQGGWSRFPAAHVEHARLVHSIRARKQAVPIDGSKQRPNRNGADICAHGPKRAGGAPDLHEPPQLLITSSSRKSCGAGARAAAAADARPQRQIETGLEGVAGDAAEALREALGIAVVAPGADLRAPGHRIPSRVGPLDGARI